MIKKYKLSFLILLFFCGTLHELGAQELSTQGKNFWLTFIENLGGTGGCGDNTVPQLKIVISCNKATTGTVKNPVNNVTMPFSIGTGGGVDTVLVPVAHGYITGSEGTSQRNRGLYIQAADTIAVSAQNSKQFSCDATLVYPVEALGVDYRIFSHMGDQTGSSTCYKSCFTIVATENSTTIDITPTCATTGGNPANVMFTITLQKGETYMVKANTHRLDLSGTLVQARDCKKIAVFGGSTRSSVLYGSCAASYDQLWEQLMPINMWGKKFICIPTLYAKNKPRKAEMLRVVASLNSTTVRCNGRLKVLAAGQADTFFITTNSIIICNKPVGICQYALTEDCDKITGGSDTDPMMMWVAPIEQSLKNLSFTCENAQTINKFFLNVVVKTSYRNSFTLDGIAPTAAWNLVTKDTSYSYIQQDGLTQGKHNINSPYGFSAVLYAYGDHGSYGFNAGSSVKPLSFYSIVSGKSSADFESDSMFYSVCQGTSIAHDGGGSNVTGVTWKWIIRDKLSTVIKTSKNFSYTYKDTGNFPVEMIAQRPTNGVCNGQTTIDDTIKYEVRVFKKPDIRLMKDTTICLGNSVRITSWTDGDTTYTFSPATWLNCTKCYQPVSKPLKDTTYYVTATLKGCQPSRDTMHIKVRDSFFLSTSSDTTICRGTSTTMTAKAWGGLTSALTVTWDNGLGTGLSKTVKPKKTTTYRAILTDGCTRDANGNFYADTGFIKVTVHDSLKITMPRDTVLCDGNTVTFTVSISGGVPGNSIVTWNKGLGTGLSKTVTADTNITYKAVLSDGCTVPKDSGYVKIIVRPGLKIDTVNFPTPVCKNQAIKISAKASGGDSTGYRFKLYDITAGNMIIDSAQNTTSPKFNAKVKDDNQYYISFRQTCNSNQINTKLAHPIKIKIKTGLDITNPTPVDTICTGQIYSLKINGTSADKLPIKFVLKRKNGASYIDIDSTIHASTGTFSINPSSTPTDYMIVGDDNCSRTDTTTFQLHVRVPMTLAKLADDELCRNVAKSYTASVTGGKVQSYTYRWYDISDNSPLGTNQGITWTPAQTMEIGLEVLDGCSPAVNTKALIKLAPMVTDSAMITDTAGCEPFSTEFIYPTTQGIAPVNTNFKWTWTFDGVNPNTVNTAGGALLPNIPKNYSTAGQHTARVQMILSNNNICFDKTVKVSSWKVAVADFSYSPLMIDIIEPEVTFTNKSTGATQYNWTYTDGGTDNIEHPKHSFVDTGWYDITLIASNANGCNDTITQSLQVQDIFRIFIPNAFSPNHDEFNTFWAPHMTSILTCEVTIFNRWGEKLFFSVDNLGQWDGKYRGENCESGVYYYHLKIRDNRKKWHYYNGMISLIR
jgi:gliding motility-associated-like protein